MTCFRLFKNLLRGGPGTTKDEKKTKKTKKKQKKKKNGKKTKKTRFFAFFGFFKNWLKIGHFGGLRASLGEEGREPLKRKKTSEKKNEKTYENQMKKKQEKKRENNKKPQSFLRALDFSKIGKKSAILVASGREAPKTETLGSLSLQEPLQGKLCSKMESLGNLSNFGDDFGDVFGDK